MANLKQTDVMPVHTTTFIGSSWFGRLGKVERRTFWASFGGFGLDALDIVLYSFAIPTLIKLWSMTRGQAGLIATVALVISAFGGWIGGILSDRFGRSVTLQVTILWFSIFTALSGLTHSFEQLLIVRAIQGLGFGAEWAVGAALISEMAEPEHRGKMVGFVQSSYAVGWAGAALIYAASFGLLPSVIAWRVLFFVGIVPALFIFYLRRYIPNHKPIKADKKHTAHFTEIFSRQLLRRTIFAALLATGVQGGYYAVMIWLPTFLRTSRHLTVMHSSAYLSVIIIASWLGYAGGAYMTDMIGRRRCFVLFSALTIIAALAYTLLPGSNFATLLLGFPLGFFASGTYSGLGAYFSELFPTRVRGSGMGLTYNFGRALGATFPFIIGALSTHIPLADAIGIFTACAYALVFISILLLPETNGKALEQ